MNKKNKQQKFEISLNQHSADSLHNIQEQTGLDVPGAVRFALVVAQSCFMPNATDVMRQDFFELALRDGRNEL